MNTQFYDKSKMIIDTLEYETSSKQKKIIENKSEVKINRLCKECDSGNLCKPCADLKKESLSACSWIIKYEKQIQKLNSFFEFNFF